MIWSCRRSSYSRFAWLVLLTPILGWSWCYAGEIVRDDAIRLRVIRLAFPNAKIAILPVSPRFESEPVIDPMRRVIGHITDGIAPDHEFEVVAPASKAEQDAASDITGDFSYHSDKRIVRMQLSRWMPSVGQTYLVAVLSYSFVNSHPPRCCSSVAEILLLSEAAERIFDVLEKEPYAFTMFTSIRFLRTDTTAAEKLMIGGDYSGPASIGVSSVIFDVDDQKLKPLLEMPSLVLYEAELENADVHTLTLDERRTIGAGGKRFFFVKRSYVEKGKIFKAPVVRVVSYPIRIGLPLDWQ